MSKERELIEALRETIDKDPFPSETYGDAAQSAGEAVANGDGFMSEMVDLFDFFADFAASLADNPLFYLKVFVVVALAAVIVFFAFQLIALE